MKSHYRNKSYKGNQCNYAFVQAGSLTTSEISHTGEKSCKCNQCDYACVLAGDLRRHLETHSGEKLSKGNHCYFESVHSDNLRRHLKTHSGEKLFNYASILAGNVIKLLKIHSRENSYKCNRCDFQSVHSYDLQAMRLCICSGWQLEKTFEISLWRKIFQMQPMRLCICSLSQFDKAFENSI